MQHKSTVYRLFLSVAALAFLAEPAAAVDLNALEVALENRRLVQARTMIEQAAQSPQQGQQQNPRFQLLRAEYLLAVGQLEQAVVALQTLLNGEQGLNGEEGARAAQGLGLALLRQREVAAAVEALTAAVRQNPALWRAWNALGVAHDQLGQWAQAEAAYAQALAAQSGAAEVHSNRGYSRLLQNRAEEAVADLELAATHLPENETVRTNLQLALALAGRYEAALALSGTPSPEAKSPGAKSPGAESPRTWARALNNVGYAALLREDRETARALLSRALEASDVYYARAANNLALVDNGASPAAFVKDGS